MIKLELSIFDRNSQINAQMGEILAQFEKQERIHVNMEVISWAGGWERMVNVALYGEGLDISEVGSTWMGDFVKMDALSQFSANDLRLVGSAEDFAPALWNSGVTFNPDGSQSVWAIPWSADTRIIYFRRDLLENAGIDEKSAFETVENFENTLQALKESGVEIPFTMPIKRSRQSIHNLASFVWKAGGDFIASTGREIIFNRPEARAGMKNYFRLGKYLAPEAQELGEGESEVAFNEGRAAVTISGTWVLTQPIGAQIRQNIGVAMLPGIPWVGGSNFVIWKNCRFKREAVRLIQFLTNSSQGEFVYPTIGLPARKASLEIPFYKTDPNWKAMRQAVLVGRAFSSEQLWGLIETRLTDLLPVIWEKVLAAPEADLDAILDQFIPGLAHRLSMTLGART